MPATIPHAMGFTHIQVFMATIGDAEVDVTSLQCEPVFAGWGEFAMCSVVKKCRFRLVAGNEPVILRKKSMVYRSENIELNLGCYDEILGLIVPYIVPDELRYLVDRLKFLLGKVDEEATAIGTFRNPATFDEWLTLFRPTLIQVLRKGELLTQLTTI